MATTSLNTSVNFKKVYLLVQQLPLDQKKKLFKVLGDVNFPIPEEHKALVRKRIKNSKSTELLDWDKIKDDFEGI